MKVRLSLGPVSPDEFHGWTSYANPGENPKPMPFARRFELGILR